MPSINQITHDDDLVRSKVNFFADYFCFASETIGTSDSIEIENPLSAVEKIIFQITKNPNRCAAYIDSYLTQSSFDEYDHFKEFKSYKKLKSLIQQFKANRKPKAKISWIQSNPEFLKTLKLYKTDLKRLMFKKALRSIISYLRCVHEIDKHKIDLIELTNLIVSEFILNNHSKKDIAKVFEKIMTEEVGTFPFPKGLKEQDEKEVFIKNRTFQQQFDGIFNLLKADLIENYFIFRIYGIKPPDDFVFTYDKVTFYSPKHEKLKTVVEKVKSNKYLISFLDNDEFLVLAVIKSKYGSIDIASNDAVEIINKELQLINKVYTSNCTLEKFSFLFTSDFLDVGWKREFKDKGYSVNEAEVHQLDDNPFSFLKKVPNRYKEPLLRNESIYLDALINKNVSTYWQYLETILPARQNDEKQIIDMVSNLLLLNTETYHKNRLKNYIFDSMTPFVTSANQLGITTERQLEIFNHPNSIDWDKLLTEIKHPFILHLLTERQTRIDRKEFLKRKSTYERVLWDAQAQRNAIIHKGLANEKALISLTGQLPRLVTRLRWVIFDGIRQKLGKDYEETILKLRDKATKLI